MSDRPQLPYQTPGASLPRSPPRRESQMDPRGIRVSSSGAKASPPRKDGPSKNHSGSRNAADCAVSRPRDDVRCAQTPPRVVAFDVPPLRSVVPVQHPLPPPPVLPLKGKNTKGCVPRTESSKNPSLKRRASEAFVGSSDPAEQNEVAPVIRSVSVSKKKVTFKHIDLEVFKEKHELQAFEVRFYAPEDDITYELLSKYQFDEFHLLTTVGAFEAGLMLPLYKSDDSFYYDVLAGREGSSTNTHSRSVSQLSGNYLRALKECYLRSKGQTTMTCYVPNPAEREWYTPENFNNSFGDYVNSRNRKPWSVSLRNLAAPRGEIRLLSEVNDAKLKYVPGTEGSSQRKLFPARERIKRDHDYE